MCMYSLKKGRIIREEGWTAEESERRTVSSSSSLFQGCPPPEAGDANYSSSCEQFVQPIFNRPGAPWVFTSAANTSGNVGRRKLAWDVFASDSSKICRI